MQAQQLYKIDHRTFSERSLPILAQDLRKLSKLSVQNSILAIAFDWSVIVAAFTLALTFDNFISYFVAMLLIASRQHALLSLMHDGAHQRLAQNKKLNEFLSDVFCALPIFIQTNAYREHHLKHHRNLNTMDDPDWVRKHTMRAWTYPMTKKEFVWYHLRYALGYGIYEWGQLLYKFSGFYKKSMSSAAVQKDFVLRISYYALIAGALSYFNFWHAFLWLWCFTYYFPFQILQRMRSTAEHFGLKHQHELNQTRNVFAPKWEKEIFAPHNLNYHLAHHMFPSVPFYNLPKLHERLMEIPEYRKDAYFNDSYISTRSQKSLMHDLVR
jgi:fatty acid desaturase